jgi:hypothetical protein
MLGKLPLPVHVLTLALACLIAGCYSPPPNNSLVGKPEATVIAQLGKPWTQSPGHYGMPTPDWRKKFTGEIKTAKFKKPGGEIYISFEKRNGTWYAISNDWLPKGAAF